MDAIKWNGKPIKTPGWYSGLSLEDYHSAGICDGLAVSSSDLRTCWRKSPAHMHDRWAENPVREVDKPPRHFVLGSAAHHLLLGEDRFKMKYVAQPPTYRDKKTAVEKSWHNGADFCKKWNAKATAQGKAWVTHDELKIILAMSKSLALDPLVNEGLLRGYVEHSGFAKDHETGLWLKVRPDVIPTHTGEFCDLKTAADVTTVALQSSIRSFGYHQQGALIWEVAELLKHPFDSFYLMFIETDRPYCARALPLTEDDLARGRLQNRAMIRRIANCITTDHWPGPGEGDLRALPLADAERERIDARLKFEKVGAQ
jgi:hypothetical protein